MRGNEETIIEKKIRTEEFEMKKKTDKVDARVLTSR